MAGQQGADSGDGSDVDAAGITGDGGGFLQVSTTRCMQFRASSGESRLPTRQPAHHQHQGSPIAARDWGMLPIERHRVERLRPSPGASGCLAPRPRPLIIETNTRAKEAAMEWSTCYATRTAALVRCDRQAVARLMGGCIRPPVCIHGKAHESGWTVSDALSKLAPGTVLYHMWLYAQIMSVHTALSWISPRLSSKAGIRTNPG
ncbi:hypothetical protein B0I37DRAFT_81206 [Chaetomium sp. MPI-CAGE-AT-0009]|nr:hypothetical protein B0I37DRAFT_81206 [Chaetomium sp. MPI-CAGE-AT-0009]